MPNIPAAEQKKTQALEWRDATWHGKEPTRLKLEPMAGEKVAVKPGETVRVHPVVAKQLHQQERLWQVEATVGFP
jgi:hypothetical protein